VLKSVGGAMYVEQIAGPHDPSVLQIKCRTARKTIRHVAVALYKDANVRGDEASVAQLKFIIQKLDKIKRILEDEDNEPFEKSTTVFIDLRDCANLLKDEIYLAVTNPGFIPEDSPDLNTHLGALNNEKLLSDDYFQNLCLFDEATNAIEKYRKNITESNGNISRGISNIQGQSKVLKEILKGDAKTNLSTEELYENTKNMISRSQAIINSSDLNQETVVTTRVSSDVEIANLTHLDPRTRMTIPKNGTIDIEEKNSPIHIFNTSILQKTQSNLKSNLTKQILDAKNNHPEDKEKMLLKQEILAYMKDILNYRDQKINAKSTGAFRKGFFGFGKGDSKMDKIDKLYMELQMKLNELNGDVSPEINNNTIKSARNEVQEMINDAANAAGTSSLKTSIADTTGIFTMKYADMAHQRLGVQKVNFNNLTEEIQSSVNAQQPNAGVEITPTPKAGVK
jgi:hypothetical protein